MRGSRIKLRGRRASYHCVTRVVGGARLLDARGKEVLRKQLWQVADFCGVKVFTYCIMSNHFHVLIEVPDKVEIIDNELLRRFGVLYGRDPMRVLEGTLREGGEEAAAQRARLLARMGDVSIFMKELKQRFSIWHNRTHGRYGTLWAERFKSVLVENRRMALRTVAAYIDLNPVRAGLCADPKAYRWGGYAEAEGGKERAREGIRAVMEARKVEEGLEDYRVILFGKGYIATASGGSPIAAKAVRAVMEKGGKIPVREALRCRVRYFTDGAVLGSKEFVEGFFEEHRERFGKRRKSGPRKMRGSDWDGLRVLRDLRKNVFG